MSPPSRQQGWLRGGGAVLSGLAVAAAFPPYGAWWLMPIGLAGLMTVTRRGPGRTGFWLGLLFGLGFMLPLLRWLTIIGVDAWIALSLLEASFYALMGTAWAWTSAHRWWPLAAASTWVTAEFLRGTVPFGGLPWGRLAFGLAGTPFVAWGRVGGTALVGFLVVLGTALVVQAAYARGGVAATRPWWWLSAALALVAVSFVLPTGAASSAGRVTVAAIQGDVPGQGMDPFAERRAVLHNHARTARRLGAQIRAGRLPQPDIVIWPENSTDIDPFADDAAFQEIDQAVRDVGVPALVGAVVDGPDDDHVQNMGIVWSPVSGPGETYVKRHPVPFGEYIPFRSVLTRFITRLDQIPRDFASGDKPGVLKLDGVTVGDVICFEVAYDGLVRDVVDGGSQLLVVQTNNATYTGTGQLEQQFAISRYRAVETGRSVVVAATNGVSGIIAPDGTVLDKSAQKTSDILERTVPTAAGVTPGVRLGRYVEGLLALCGVGLVVLARLDRRRRVARLSRDEPTPPRGDPHLQRS